MFLSTHHKCQFFFEYLIFFVLLCSSFHSSGVICKNAMKCKTKQFTKNFALKPDRVGGTFVMLKRVFFFSHGQDHSRRDCNERSVVPTRTLNRVSDDAWRARVNRIGLEVAQRILPRELGVLVNQRVERKRRERKQCLNEYSRNVSLSLSLNVRQEQGV